MDNLASNGDSVFLLIQQLKTATSIHNNIATLMTQIIDGNMWQRFNHPSADEQIDNSKLTFAEFVQKDTPFGLGSDLKTLELILNITLAEGSENAQEAICLLMNDCAH